jgi:glycosyltransferase involved in cell wall biosynthesis
MTVESRGTTRKNIRILIFNWRYLGHPQAGGAEFWTQRAAEELVALGHSVTVFTPTVDGLPRDEVINGIEVIRRGGTLSVYREAKRYLRNCRGRFDFVIDEVNTRPFFVHRYTDIPSRALFHQLASDVWNFEVPLPVALLGRYVFEPIWLRRYRGVEVLVVSKSTAESLEDRGLKVHKVIECGIDSSDLPIVQKSDNPTICFLGRLVPSKRPSDAIDAFKLVLREIPNAHFFIIGDGPLRAEIEHESNRHVQVTGRISNQARNEILAMSHVHVATSVREGWGMNVTEAAQLGTPTIGYDVPGLRDSITASGGLLVRESPSHLAQALIEFFKSDKQPVPRRHGRTWKDVALDLEEVMINDLRN